MPRTRPRPRSVRSSPIASSIRRPATASSRGCSATAPSPTTCCACAAPIGSRSGSRSRPTPRRSTDGGIHIEALMRDVSERKRLEDQARDLYHQLLQAEKLAALGQTISGVAHELNNPLATILTWAERLSQRPVDDQTRRGLETILERVGARRQDRPQPADLRAQAAHHARDGRRQPGRPRNAGAALLRADAREHQHHRSARRRPAAGLRRSRTSSSRSCST